ncbi:MAG: DMT family transporter [Flavobacteriaceae bacterium]|nr:DMT family transporter [Flavobacteriaceae bacterium]
MDHKKLKWIFLAILSVIWGSSFILIKKGLIGLDAYQLGSLRIIFTAVFLFLIGFKSFKKIEKRHYKPVVISALLGTFIPVYMFALAETEIDSSIASILNSLTPLNTLIFGFFFFKMSFSKNQLVGVIIGLLGTLLLIVSGANLNPDQNYWFSIFVIIASVCYAFNVSIIKTYLQDLNAMSIAVGNFAVITIPAVIVLFFTGFFKVEVITSEAVQTSMLYLVLLAIFGTGIAKVMFNRLVQISTPIFSSSVTYTIPIVALIWGVLDGEKLNMVQIGATVIILLGVFMANRKK